MTTVFINGVFDLLAPHHVSFIRRAREYGDELIVGLNSDKWVVANKGLDRPFYDEHDRRAMLLQIRGVDVVHLFDTEDELADLIRRIRPEYLIKGEEYENRPVTGAGFAKCVVFLKDSFVGGISTTVIQRIRFGRELLSNPRCLCVCRGGRVRSVALRKILTDEFNVDAIACGFEKQSTSTMAYLCRWATTIFVMRADFVAHIPPEHGAKVIVTDVGEDRWGTENSAELRDLCRLKLVESGWKP